MALQLLNIRKFYKMYQNMVRFKFFFRIGKRFVFRFFFPEEKSFTTESMQSPEAQ